MTKQLFLHRQHILRFTTLMQLLAMVPVCTTGAAALGIIWRRHLMAMAPAGKCLQARAAATPHNGTPYHLRVEEAAFVLALMAIRYIHLTALLQLLPQQPSSKYRFGVPVVVEAVQAILTMVVQAVAEAVMPKAFLP